MAPREIYTPQHPTVAPAPVAPVSDDAESCANCPGWHRTNPRYPFGQCLPAIRALGAPLYTTDRHGCSLSPAEKAKR